MKDERDTEQRMDNFSVELKRDRYRRDLKPQLNVNEILYRFYYFYPVQSFRGERDRERRRAEP